MLLVGKTSVLVNCQLPNLWVDLRYVCQLGSNLEGVLDGWP
jgi:hypothetical protein